MCVWWGTILPSSQSACLHQKVFQKLFEFIFILLSLFCCPCKNTTRSLKPQEAMHMMTMTRRVFFHSVPLARWPRWTWYRMFSCGADVRECHADIASSRFTRWRRIGKKQHECLVTHWSKLRFFLIVRDFFLQESTATMISCSLAKCCTTSVGQSLAISLRDCTIHWNLHLHLYLQGKACTHKHCWRTKMVSGTLNNKLKDIEVSFRAAYDILAISHKGFSDFA